MSKLDDFMQLLCGEFDNREQFEAKQATGETFPLAHHVNTACNDKILGLPDDFAGTFMVEESYYEVDGRKSTSPHLFLFTEEKDGVLLTSYDTPEGNDKRTFSYATMVPAEFSSLRESGKFTPALYREHDGVWEGGSDSMFSPVMRFHLFERFSADVLEVSESTARPPIPSLRCSIWRMPTASLQTSPATLPTSSDLKKQRSSLLNG